ncbi:MAG: hypothetical protein CL610_24470 [Anaerolineaceae bacterium]|nr:hypothetical protein [Anaerolineaceae bacterium]
MTKNIFTGLAGLYGLMLLVYLVLRFLLPVSPWWLAFLHNFTPYYFLPLLVLIPLLWLMRARRMAARLLPLLLIGLLLYAPRWLPQPAVRAAEARTLRVVTFNVLILTDEYATITDWLRTADADVVLLQEVDGQESTQIFDALSDLYPHTVDLEGTTVIALSRYPVVEQALVDLGSWYVDRFVLAIDGAPVAVYNVHMHMPLLNEPRFPFTVNNGMVQLALQYDETHRNQLIRRLLDLLAAEPLPYIVAGDFNTGDNTPIYGEMAALLHDSYREAGIGLGNTWPASIGDDEVPAMIPPMLRIDYVWHSADLRAVAAAVGPDLSSDHLPVITTLAVRE